ncbi:MAG TPA: TorF family putative porin [Bdellovibrionales bacterium]|nr:TorF family putative porin [Bdellovibrionales bacterium]
MLKFLILIAALLGFSNPLFGAEILKASKRIALVEFDPFEENFVVGDRLNALRGESKEGLIEITKIKGGKFLARILAGKASPGMSLKRFDVMSETKPTPNAPNVETVTLRIFSNYVWRGISYNMPYIAGAIDYVNEGVLAGLNISNAERPATSEVDLSVGYALNRINWTLTPMIIRYMYPGQSRIDSTDFNLSMTYRLINAELSYIPRYFGARSDQTYAKIGTLFSMSSRWKAAAHLGYARFSEKTQVDLSDYRDYKLAVIYAATEFTVEFAFTDTNRAGARDESGAVLISKTF